MAKKEDKYLEYQRYDKRASTMLSLIADAKLGTDIKSLIPKPLVKPYLVYEEIINRTVDKTSLILEIGSGYGLHTSILCKTGAKVTATDISENSLNVLRKTLGLRYSTLETEVADMESLPFEADSFDVVCSAGSLSYGDNTIVRDEIFRVLKQGGSFICVDSLSHNPIYKINRWLHFLRGERTLSTLKRMPTLQLLENYSKTFGRSELYFFGAFAWLSPIFCKFINETSTAKILESMDKIIQTKKAAFKFVMIVHKDCS